jgi:transposase
VESPAPPTTDAATIAAHLVAREERIKLLEEENLKAQLFGRSSEKTPAEEVSPDQGWLFNEAEALVHLSQSAPEEILIPAHERKKRGRKPLSPDLPRVEVLHDLADHEKVCAKDGSTLECIGEEICEQLDYKPAHVRVLRHIRPKYACPCCREGVKIAPTPLALLAHIVTAKFVDGTPFYRQETQFACLGVTLGRATMAGWMIRLGGTHLVPLINLLNEQMLEQPLIHSLRDTPAGPAQRQGAHRRALDVGASQWPAEPQDRTL